jgi:DNA repair protein RadC
LEHTKLKNIARHIKEPGSLYSSDSVDHKIFELGTEGLSDAQLLSVFIRAEKDGRTALQIAQDVMSEVKNLHNLVNMESKKFTQLTGLGKASYIKFRAAIELDRRRLFVDCCSNDVLSSPEHVREFLHRNLAGVEDEVFGAVLLNNRHQTLQVIEMSVGTLDSAAVYPRSVAKHCLNVNAAAVIFFHQHPSMVSEPSDTDVRLTRKLIDALALLDIRVLDHVVLGGNLSASVSLAERGLM